MSNLDLSAAARALFEWNTPTDPFFVIHGRAGDVSEGDPYLPIVTAIAETVEAQVRAQVAAEEVRLRAMFEEIGRYGRDLLLVNTTATTSIGNALIKAARIARGESS